MKVFQKIVMLISIAAVVILYSFIGSKGNSAASYKNVIHKGTALKKGFNFFIISDWGWSGLKFQQEVADQMAKSAEEIKPNFIISCGDNFQDKGVVSVNDPLWKINFEDVYKQNSLQIDWYPVLGNHDYKGSTQAQIDYSNISKRWKMKSPYYTFVKKINDSISARFIFLDTPPLVKDYYTKKGYPDVFKQDTALQVAWLKGVLANSKEQWKIVFGHHPIYSASNKHGNTEEMIEKINPILKMYKAQMYFCGHDHDLQHLKEKNGKMDYFVTGTGGEPRPCSSNQMTVFSRSTPAFSSISLFADSIQVNFIDSKGVNVYSMKRRFK